MLPGLRVVRKRDSKLMRVLNVVLFFVPNFLENYTTTLGKTIYLSETLWFNTRKSCLPTLAHEARHAYDSQQLGTVWFSLMYLFPQVLAVLALLAIPFSLWWLTALAFLLPWPAWGRVIIEFWGYSTTAIVTDWLYGRKAAYEQIDWCRRQFVGPAYYFMGWLWWPQLKAWMGDELDEEMDAYTKHVYGFVNAKEIQNAD